MYLKNIVKKAKKRNIGKAWIDDLAAMILDVLKWNLIPKNTNKSTTLPNLNFSTLVEFADDCKVSLPFSRRKILDFSKLIYVA